MVKKRTVESNTVVLLFTHRSRDRMQKKSVPFQVYVEAQFNQKNSGLSFGLKYLFDSVTC